MKNYLEYIVSNGKETPIKQITPAHQKAPHYYRVYETIWNTITGDDEFLVAEFYGDNAKRNAEEFLSKNDPTRRKILALGYYLPTDDFEELENAFYILDSVVDKTKRASDYVDLADCANQYISIEEILEMIS